MVNVFAESHKLPQIFIYRKKKRKKLYGEKYPDQCALAKVEEMPTEPSLLELLMVNTLPESILINSWRNATGFMKLWSLVFYIQIYL